jgi:hypothetical protein
MKEKNHLKKFILTEIDVFHQKIIDISKKAGNEKYLIQNQWEIIKLEWNKNRLIFFHFFKKKKVSKMFFKRIRQKINLDLNLINLWKKRMYENLCSTQVIFLDSFCRIPFEEKENLKKFVIQERTGCISCSTSNGFDSPIWWNNFEKIKKILVNWYAYEFLKVLSKKNFLFDLIFQKNFIKNEHIFFFLEINLNFLKINFNKKNIKTKIMLWFKRKKKIKNSLFLNLYWKIFF